MSEYRYSPAERAEILDFVKPAVLEREIAEYRPDCTADPLVFMHTTYPIADVLDLLESWRTLDTSDPMGIANTFLAAHPGVTILAFVRVLAIVQMGVLHLELKSAAKRDAAKAN